MSLGDPGTPHGGRYLPEGPGPGEPVYM